MNYPVLSTSPRDFWHRQTLFQREALHNCVLEPLMKITHGKYDNKTRGLLATFCLFGVNMILHSVMSLQLQGSLFIKEWLSGFIVIFIITYGQIFCDNYFEKNNPKILNTFWYKLMLFALYHVMWYCSSIFMGYEMFPIGVQGSGYFVDNWI